MTATVYLVVITAFGAVELPARNPRDPGAVLVGLSFSAPIAAWAAHTRDGGVLRRDLPLRDPADVPLLGDVLPDLDPPAPLEVIAYLTPLWHGVTLCRDLTLGDVEVWTALGHLGYLLAFVAVGLALARIPTAGGSSCDQARVDP